MTSQVRIRLRSDRATADQVSAVAREFAAGPAIDFGRRAAERGMSDGIQKRFENFVGPRRERSPPFPQRGIDPGPQLAANHEVRDRRRDGDGQRERNRRPDAQPCAQAHSGTLCSRMT